VAHIPHGGDLSEGERVAGVRPWLDLSTGINPHAYPVTIGPVTMTALPQRDLEEKLLAAARTAYAVPQDADIVAAPGTQAILQWLPHLFPAADVAVVAPTYGEHAALWRRSGASVREVGRLAQAAGATRTVVVNPNNPDGRITDPADIRGFAAAPGPPRLIVDEAFCDLDPALSAAGAPGTIVLKSFGKFYGLAGLRLGFAIAAPPVADAIRSALGPWAVSGPALAAGAAALADTGWARRMRRTLAAERSILDGHLAGAGLAVTGGTDLFRLVQSPQAASLHAALAREGVWTRRFPERPHWLRIGLPGPAIDGFAETLRRVARRA